VRCNTPAGATHYQRHHHPGVWDLTLPQLRSPAGGVPRLQRNPCGE
jgi:hypothetical protein